MLKVTTAETMEEPMMSQFGGYYRRGAFPRCATVLAAALILAAGSAPSQAAEVKQKTFTSAKAAAKALVDSVRTGDKAALLKILGPGSEELISSGDEVADRMAQQRFVKSYSEANRIELIGNAAAILHVGRDEWQFPIPLVKQRAGWRFDTADGKEEILNRRIGRNELNAIQVCLAYVDAQREFYLKNPTGDGVLQYAQKFFSEKDNRDGLYWETAPGKEPSPLGPLVAEASAGGYSPPQSAGKRAPYWGYNYRILKAQGREAPGGAYDYVVGDKMIAGFALVAFPAQYGSSGIMTFVVNHAGVVYEKNLGPQTGAIAQAMTEFNPDSTWKKF